MSNLETFIIYFLQGLGVFIFLGGIVFVIAIILGYVPVKSELELFEKKVQILKKYDLDPRYASALEERKPVYVHNTIYRGRV